MKYKFDPAELCELVGLERTYEFEVKAKTDLGRFAGLTYPDGRIELAAGLSEKRAKQVLLHEIGHVIAMRTLLDSAPDSECHNKYFATLVAVMYRRAGLLDALKIYDFADELVHVRWNGDGPLPSDDELVSRFAFIVYRSAVLAKKPWSVEQIGKHLFTRMLDEVAGRSIAPESYQRPLAEWFLQLFKLGGRT